MSSNNKNSNTPKLNNSNNKANTANKANSNNKANTANKANTNNKASSNNKANTIMTNNVVEMEEGGEYDVAYILGKMYLNNQSTRIILVSMLVIIIFLVAVYLLYHYSTGRKVQVLQNKLVPLFNDTSVVLSSSNMNPSFNNKQTYIIYINFDNSAGNHIWYHSFMDNKIILRRVDDNFMVKYNPHTNKLVVDVRIKKLDIEQASIDTESGSNPSNMEQNLGLHATYEHIYVPNVPHHKWLQVAIMIDNRLVDIYFNTKLAASRVLDNVPILSNTDMLLGQEYHNPNAFVGRLEYTNNTLSELDLKSLYHKNMRFLKINPVIRDMVVQKSVKLRTSTSPTEST